MRLSALSLSLLLLTTPVAALEPDVERQQAKLQQLADQIRQQQGQLAQAQINKDKQLKALRQAEKAVSDSAASVRRSQQALQGTDTALASLAEQAQTLQQRQQAEQQQLANQLRTAWMSGDQDATALLLGNDDPARLERMMVYYQYLNQARIDAIDTVKQTRAELQQITEQQQQVRAQQAELHQQQAEQQRTLERRQSERQQALAQLDQRLSQGRQQLDQLQENRDVLAAAIEQALEALAQSQHHLGLSEQKGQLPWPLSGTISHRFGQPRQGQLKWNGWLLSAPSGREINAIASGQVVFADWLRGFGLVLVVDHGDEYLSLYGHAQALLRQVGEQVQAGDTVGLSGDSGGLEKPGLYFEIRHRGRAVDPKLYLRKG
ncbi:murein hydrolase activator EnvC family protein [Ferrimonas pelagia]|uniref:Peptidoglycan DD-metalloendopeptidase family protein n=1 Tax=Ferrimonas pelagia TaxID=1177826 RepID=A0ABP9EGH4_9GAMM